MIPRVSSSLSSSCKNFNVAHYSKSIKDITTKQILAQHDKVQLQDKGHNYENYCFGVMPFVDLEILNLEILSKLLIKYNKVKTIKDINIKL